MKLSDLCCFLCGGEWASESGPFAAGFDESCANAFAQDFVFELRED
jgi:hypothetical protein